MKCSECRETKAVGLKTNECLDCLDWKMLELRKMIKLEQKDILLAHEVARSSEWHETGQFVLTNVLREILQDHFMGCVFCVQGRDCNACLNLKKRFAVLFQDEKVRS